MDFTLTRSITFLVRPIYIAWGMGYNAKYTRIDPQHTGTTIQYTRITTQ